MAEPRLTRVAWRCVRGRMRVQARLKNPSALPCDTLCEIIKNE